MHADRTWAVRAMVLATVGVVGVTGFSCGTVGVDRRTPVVREVFRSAGTLRDNIDSLAFWAPGGSLFATAKDTHQVLEYAGDSGALRRRIGEQGIGPGQLLRPNGIAVVDDLLLVVERDNHRVQLFRLPAFQVLATFGETQLMLPYGIAVARRDDSNLDVFVTDAVRLADDAVPVAAEDLAKRVKRFHVRVTGDRVQAALVSTFGATAGAGILRVVESIAVDPAFDRLLIADEHEGARDIKVYTLDGVFTGRVIGHGLFQAEPEGIALAQCGGGGVWVATDQRATRTVFHLFARDDLRHLGAFVGERVANTDGIAVVSPEAEACLGGAVFAVDDDQAVAAFRWRDVAGAVALGTACGLAGGAASPIAASR